jgi:hypothetical protein
MYESVPMMVPGLPGEPIARATPKSRIFTTPSSPTMMFEGLRSR